MAIVCYYLFAIISKILIATYTDSHEEHVLYFWYFEGRRRFKTILYKYLILIAVIGIYLYKLLIHFISDLAKLLLRVVIVKRSVTLILLFCRRHIFTRQIQNTTPRDKNISI